MPYMKSLSLMVQKLWPRLKFFATEPQTDRTKTRCPRISFRGHKNLMIFIPAEMHIHDLNLQTCLTFSGLKFTNPMAID